MRCKSRGILYGGRHRCGLPEGHGGWHVAQVERTCFEWDAKGNWRTKEGHHLVTGRALRGRNPE